MWTWLSPSCLDYVIFQTWPWFYLSTMICGFYPEWTRVCFKCGMWGLSNMIVSYCGLCFTQCDCELVWTMCFTHHDRELVWTVCFMQRDCELVWIVGFIQHDHEPFFLAWTMCLPHHDHDPIFLVWTMGLPQHDHMSPTSMTLKAWLCDCILAQHDCSGYDCSCWLITLGQYASALTLLGSLSGT